MTKMIRLVSALAIAAALLVGTIVISTPVAEAGDPSLSRNYHVWCGSCSEPCESTCDPNWRPSQHWWCELYGCSPGAACWYVCEFIN